MKLKKIIAILLLTVTLITITNISTLAVTNEKVIFKNSNNEYLIYYKELCKKEFEFAISTNKNIKESELDFRNSAKDQPETEVGALNVAYIDKNLFEEIFEENTINHVAYIWIKDKNNNVIIEADEINIDNALTEEMITLVNTTTKVNEKTDRIEIDTTQEHVTHPEVEGVETTVKTGKIIIKGNENSKYYYSLIKVTDQEDNTAEMYELAKKMTENNKNDTYERLSLEKQFYDLYKKLTPTENDWTEVENLEILQPETARTDDKYIVYIKETNKEKTIVDVKLLVSKYDYQEKRINEEDKVITETVKLPATFDRGMTLLIALGVIITMLLIFIFMKVNLRQKDESK